MLIHNRVLKEFDIKVDRTKGDEILIVNLLDKISSQHYCLGVCYLSPENLPYGKEADIFCNRLKEVVCENISFDSILLMDNLNSRIGAETDYFKGIDNILDRINLDTTINWHGRSLLEFLFDSKC